jgi:zinc transporter ZupT
VAGAVVGLFVGSLEGTMASEAILPVTAGGFIYVATCGVIPQLFESTSFGQSLLEALAMIFGVAIMAYIAFELE